MLHCVANRQKPWQTSEYLDVWYRPEYFSTLGPGRPELCKFIVICPPHYNALNNKRAKGR